MTFDGEVQLTDATTVADTYDTTVSYAHTTSGTYTLKVTYVIDGQQVDTRVLKVFVQE